MFCVGANLNKKQFLISLLFIITFHFREALSLSFAVVSIKIIFVIKTLRREALASDNLALPLTFFNLLRSLKIFTICENRP